MFMNEKNKYIVFNSQELKYKSIFGAVPCETAIIFNIEIAKELKIRGIYMYVYVDNVNIPTQSTEFIFPMKKNVLFSPESKNYCYTLEYITGKEPRLLFYYFKIVFEDGQEIFYGNNKEGLGGEGRIYSSNPVSYQITTYYKGSTTPSWYKEAIIYQIFPDRFYNGNPNGAPVATKSNTFIYGNWNDKPVYLKGENGDILRWDFFGGNLIGISKKLPYLSELGINLIYLNPIFQAASNHRYDTGDYEKVDNVLGTEEDFDNLIKKSKEKGIGIILDGVFNHTGRNSKYFNRFGEYDTKGAYNSPDSPYYSWFSFMSYPDNYVSWWGNADLPCVNELEPSFLDYIIRNENSIVSKWLNKGIRGWRLDVADELPSEFLKILKVRTKEIDKESVLLGEVWEDASNKVSYNVRREYFCGKELDSVTNYLFRDIMLDFFSEKSDSEKTKDNFLHLQENYPLENFYALTNILGSHDTPRILTLIKGIVGKLKEKYFYYEKNIDRKNAFEKNEEKLPIRLLKLASLVQMTFPGVPLLYYGDEAGVEGEKDPDNRRTYPWGLENKDLVDWYKQIIKLRQEFSLLSTGDIKHFTIDRDIYGYIRYLQGGKDAFGVEKKDDVVIVIINRNPIESKYFNFPLDDFTNISAIKKANSFYELNKGEIKKNNNNELSLNLEPTGYIVLSNKKFKK